MSTITITFRTKKTEFSGGDGYKVPRMLLPKHYTYSSDLSGKFSPTNPGWNAGMVHRLLGKAGYQLPAIVWCEPRWLGTMSAEKANEELREWAITPVGDGFMVDVSRTYEI
jgi:hypothetical protein